METSVVKRSVCGYQIYYIDSPKITTTEANVPADIVAAEGPFEIAYIHPNDNIDRASQVILQITGDRFIDDIFVGRVIYVWTVNIIKDPTTGVYELVDASKMNLTDDLNVSHINVTAVVNGIGVNVPEYNIQLRSRCTETCEQRTESCRKKLIKISRK
jgi:hypothetical protein